MSSSPNNQYSTEKLNIFDGLPAAILFALLLIGTFALRTADTTMPPGERWAALTTFSLLSFGYVLQGSVGIYDALGRVVRHNVRALASLLALVPALYVSYSVAIDEFTWTGLLTAIVFVALPAVAFLFHRGKRTPTLLDFTAVLYIWLSVELDLVPALALPQQGAQVGFFFFLAIPMLLVLLATRGWPGLGFTWFLSSADLLTVLMATLVLLAALTPLALATGFVQRAAGPLIATDLLGEAVLLYFLVALPQEIVFRGVIQNGIERVLVSVMRRSDTSRLKRLFQPVRRHSHSISLILAALIFGVAQLAHLPLVWQSLVLAPLAGLGYGWVYQRTGKVTASAVAHMFVIWCWSIFFTGVRGI